MICRWKPPHSVSSVGQTKMPKIWPASGRPLHHPGNDDDDDDDDHDDGDDDQVVIRAAGALHRPPWSPPHLRPQLQPQDHLSHGQSGSRTIIMTSICIIMISISIMMTDILITLKEPVFSHTKAYATRGHQMQVVSFKWRTITESILHDE